MVMASVNLADLKDDDVWIGYNEKLLLSEANQTFVLDTSKSNDPLPSGEYEVEVNFYPRWGADNNEKAKNVPELRSSQNLTLLGSGQTEQSVKVKNDRQRWVMSSLDMNTPWDEARFVTKLGPYEKYQSDMSHLHDAYYFPESDITLLVNRLKVEVTVWRLGRVKK